MSQRNRKTSAEFFGVENTGALAGDEDFTMETREASPAHLLIKIQSFSLLSEHGIKKYESREFGAGGYTWRLIIHPNGPVDGEEEEEVEEQEQEEEEEKYISVYLTIVKTSTMPVDWEVNAVFSIFLYSQISDKYICFQSKMRRFHALRSQWGFSKLISKESLRAPGNGFLLDNNCVFGAEVLVMNKSQRIVENVSLMETDRPYKREWKISHFSKLEGIWYSEEFTAGDKKMAGIGIGLRLLHPVGDTLQSYRFLIFMTPIKALSLMTAAL